MRSRSATSVRIVSGNRRPHAVVSAPSDGTAYDAGDTIVFGGSASDSEEGAMPCSAFSWFVAFHHADPETQLRGADCRDVAAGARADYPDVEFVSHEVR